MIQAGSLFVVLLVARALTIIGHEAGFAAGVQPIVHGVLEDAAIATSLALLDATFRRPRLTWIVYIVLAGVAAIDVLVTRSLGTPLTPVMLRGARVALADSILSHATFGAVLRIATVVGVAVLMPLAWLRLRVPTASRDRLRAFASAAALLLSISAIGVAMPGAAPPFHKNSLVALVGPLTNAPPVRATIARISALETECAAQDLGALRGIARGRNVLFVVLESTGVAPLGLYGAAGEDPMPRLTSLARDGLVFDAAYSTFPESIRSQVAFWESRHPRIGQMPRDLADPPVSPLPEILTRHGYRTALVHAGHFDYLGMHHLVDGRGLELLADADDIATAGGDEARATSFGVTEEAAVDHVLRWIDSGERGVPWFAAYLPIAGHHPYDTPRAGPFSATSAQSQHRNALRYADDALAALLDGLAARGVLDDTLVIVTGDHGEAFGEHPGNYGHTFQLFDENVHVPLVIALPGRNTARRLARVASHVDLAPTALDLLDIPAPNGWEGASLLDPTPRIALFATDWSERLIGLRDGRYKCILSLDSDTAQLFDLGADPGETTNLAARLPEITARYRRRLTASDSAADRAPPPRLRRTRENVPPSPVRGAATAPLCPGRRLPADAAGTRPRGTPGPIRLPAALRAR